MYTPVCSVVLLVGKAVAKLHQEHNTLKAFLEQMRLESFSMPSAANRDSLGPSDLFVGEPSGEFGSSVQPGLSLFNVLSQLLLLRNTTLITGL